MGKTAIDFIGHHRMHFQSLRPIIEALGPGFECRELIGPDVTPSGASVAVVTDHLAFQPKIHARNYTQLVHVAHDLSDLNVYYRERKRLQEFSLILVPSEIHKTFVSKHLPGVECTVVGWTKDGEMLVDSPTEVVYSDASTILFAWTDINSTNWRKILLGASKSKLKFKVKNHVYFENEMGLEPPKNQQKEYFGYIEETRAMEKFFKENNLHNIRLIDSDHNLNDIAFRHDVLVTDYSSAALEFARFGIAVETGIPSRVNFPGLESKRRATSALVKEVRYISERELIGTLPNMTMDDFLRIPQNFKAPYSASEFRPKLRVSSPKVAAEAIRNLILAT